MCFQESTEAKETLILVTLSDAEVLISGIRRQICVCACKSMWHAAEYKRLIHWFRKHVSLCCLGR